MRSADDLQRGWTAAVHLLGFLVCCFVVVEVGVWVGVAPANMAHRYLRAACAVQETQYQKNNMVSGV